ncbi:XdhC/CoxI family protein [Peribacillus asahii]|uniref:XdhC/CoxI family protein n=1 Tax=Peribacillus asahii TaxID=228899 RepID=A0A398B1G3_9BACI|nr:XdhC/CoxI family protein [Peribacillus asahii]RID83511.1 XdhC/CoxI family protein [Peribacillus asahii]
MSRLQEFKELFQQMKQAWERNEQAALVMLISANGSAYRLPGAKMMMTRAGEMFGTISGGCLESDLYGWAEQAMDRKTPHVQTYNLSERDIWGLGIGCKGVLNILILPIEREDEFWLKINGVLERNQAFSLVLEIPTGRRLIVQKDGKRLGDAASVPNEVVERARSVMEKQTRAEVFTYKGYSYWIDAVKPSESLIVAGAGRDSIPVVELATKAGFAVTVLDPREELNNPRFFPSAAHHIVKHSTAISSKEMMDCWWIIMNHHQQHDEDALQLALSSHPRFVGVLGPMSRTEEMLSNIGRSFSSGPIRSPLGLDLGAETMEEVAISIVSELMAVRSGRNPRPLHGKAKIHE